MAMFHVEKFELVELPWKKKPYKIYNRNIRPNVKLKIKNDLARGYSECIQR